MKRFRLLSAFMVFCIVFSALFAASVISVRAEDTTYTFDELLAQDKVKIQGRTTPGMATAVWAGNAIEMNIETAGGDIAFDVITTEDKVLFEGFIDGESIGRSNVVTPDDPQIRFSGLPSGTHTISVVRETPTNKSGLAMVLYDKVTFNGTVLERPADKELYIEILGDSVACGSGALGTYEQGKAWNEPDDHSATHSFGYYIAKALDADYSIVAAGGIGLYDVSSDKQESYSGVSATLQEIYDYNNGFSDLGDEDSKYSFSRKADLVIIRVGANDDTKNEELWKEKFLELVKKVRDNNGEYVPIIYSGDSSNAHYMSVLTLARGELKNKNVFFAPHKLGGSGSAALASQKAGHPNAEEQKALADSILEIIKANNLDTPIDYAAENEYYAEENKAAEKDASVKKYALIGGAAAAGLVVVIVVIVVCCKASKKKKEKAKKKSKK